MTIEELGALSNILREIKEVMSDSSDFGWNVEGYRELKDIYKDYRSIFIEACETNRERIKHFLKK